MPVVLAVASALISGLFLWLIWGGGFQYVDHKLREREARKVDAKRWREAEERRRLAPLKAVGDPRDAATILMVLLAQLRGVPTPEQIAAIEQEMRTVLELSSDLQGRLAYARFAAEQTPNVDAGLENLVALFRKHLTASERSDLVEMMRRVSAVHDGPTDQQRNAIERLERLLAAAV